LCGYTIAFTSRVRAPRAYPRAYMPVPRPLPQHAAPDGGA
jgi:hypothetical protein